MLNQDRFPAESSFISEARALRALSKLHWIMCLDQNTFEIERGFKDLQDGSWKGNSNVDEM